MRGDAAMSFQEIADALGVDRREVKRLYFRAMYKLRKSEELNKLMFMAAMRKQLGDGRQPIYPEW